MTIAKLEARCVLLDIEGTISDIRFVYDVMFPYAKSNMGRFLSEDWETPAVQDAIRTVARDAERQRSKIGLAPNGKPAQAMLSRN